MRGRWALAGAAWLVAAVLTTMVAVAAVDSLGEGIFGTSDRPLRQSDVTSRLSASPQAEPTQTEPTQAGSPTAPTASESGPAGTAGAGTPQASTRVLSTAGGTIVASCAAGMVTLLSWTPRPGFQVDHVVRGPATVASLRFHAREGGDDVRTQVTCAQGQPEVAVVADDD